MKRLSIILMFLLLLSFTITASAQSVRVPPTVPTPLEPSGLENSHAPQFTWTGDAAATHYKIIVFNANNNIIFAKWYTSAAAFCEGGTACAVSPSLDGLTLYNKQYSWRVIAKNAEGTAGSPKKAFRIQYPGKANLISPIDDATVGPTTAFEWDEVVQADQYRVVVKKTSTGVVTASGWLSGSGVCFSGHCIYTFPNPLKRGLHTWRVETRNSGQPGYKSTSRIEPFKVVIP